MSALLDPQHYSWLSLIGYGWSLLTFWLMFSSRGRALISNPWAILIAGAALVPSLWLVTSEIAALTKLSGGVAVLDVRFGYTSGDMVALAEAFGAEGRRAYAAFQLGADSLAPPAFACFLMAVFRSTVRLPFSLAVLSAQAFVYFTSVLLANALAPVVMLAYPETDGALLSTLYAVVPQLDFVKYAAHGAAWLVILASWIIQALEALRRKPA